MSGILDDDKITLKEENEQLTKVGPGTLMGEFFRQYWVPVLPVSFIEKATDTPRCVRLLGEDLVVFRTKKGEIGLVGAYCSHRLAPLYFGRIEDDGLRCLYHGWKYAPNGTCIDMPNLPLEQQFKDDICHPGYPCREEGGIIWTYMGSSRDLPSLPQFEFLMVPEEQRLLRPFRQECNYLQAMEGGIDPTHVMWLHSPYDLADEETGRKYQPLQHRVANSSGARTPLTIEIVDTPGGFVYGAKRPMSDGNALWRINRFLLPFYTMPPSGDFRGARIWVPMDDEHCIKWNIYWFPSRSIMETAADRGRDLIDEEVYVNSSRREPYGFLIPKANATNDYLINRNIHYSKRMGVPGVNLQDICITENEGPGPILDRTRENLCSSDRTIIKARHMLMRAAREMREFGTTPPGVLDSSIYRVRGASIVLPDDSHWLTGAKEQITVPEVVKQPND